jgi:hypothetical protein
MNKHAYFVSLAAANVVAVYSPAVAVVLSVALAAREVYGDDADSTGP